MKNNKIVQSICAAILLLLFIATFKLWLIAGIVFAIYVIVKTIITRGTDNGNHSNSYQPQDGFKSKEKVIIDVQELDGDL